jgi:hypothetical protein
MIDASPSLEAAKGISGRELLVYLEGEGWKAGPSKVDGISIVSKELPGANQRAEFIVPIKAGFSDELRRVADALRTIAQIEGCSEAQVAGKIRQIIEERSHASKSTLGENVDVSGRKKDVAFFISSKRADSNTNEDIESTAQHLREFLGFSDQSVFDIVELLENDMPKVFEDFRLEVLEESGAQEIYSTKVPPRIFAKGQICDLARQGDARSRFVIAHEIGHLFLHSYSPHFRTPDRIEAGAKSVELEASQFALAFLIPSSVARGFNDPKLLSLYCKVDRKAAEMRMLNVRQNLEAEIMERLRRS